MSASQIQPADFTAMASEVVDIFRDEFGIQLTFDAAGVAGLETYLEHARTCLPSDARDEAVTRLGAFLGECIIARCGGTWSHEPGWWGVRLAEGIYASPFVQVESQLASGLEQSVLRYHSCLFELSSRMAKAEARVAA